MSTSKKNSFFPIGPMSSALMRSTASAATGDMPGPPAKGAFSSEGEKDKQKEVAQCKSQQQASLARVVEEFFWIGSSIVAFSKWRLGYMGKLSPILTGYYRNQTCVGIQIHPLCLVSFHSAGQ